MGVFVEAAEERVVVADVPEAGGGLRHAAGRPCPLVGSYEETALGVEATMSVSDPKRRIELLERRVRRLVLASGIAWLAVMVIAVSAWSSQSQGDVLRVRALVITDENGAERIVMGAPIPEPEGRRIAPNTGLVINDSAGAERFGMGLLGNGNLVMGFDAAPRPGVRSNRERLTFAVDREGRPKLRFLDTNGLVRAHMELFDDDNVYLFFTDLQGDTTVVHRVDAQGDSVITHAR